MTLASKTPNAILASAKYAVVDESTHAITTYEHLTDAETYAKVVRSMYEESDKPCEIVLVDHDVSHVATYVDEGGNVVDAEPRISALEERLDEARQKRDSAMALLRFVYGLLDEEKDENEGALSIYWRMRGFASATGLWEFE